LSFSFQVKFRYTNRNQTQLYSLTHSLNRYHILVANRDAQSVARLIDACFSNHDVKYRIIDDNERLAPVFERIPQQSTSVAQMLLKTDPHQFARLFLPDYFPELDKAFYINSDWMLMLGANLSAVFDFQLNDKKTVGIKEPHNALLAAVEKYISGFLLFKLVNRHISFVVYYSLCTF
jgi:lipopolysaccharide biosynthesis glycosyltransferase